MKEYYSGLNPNDILNPLLKSMVVQTLDEKSVPTVLLKQDGQKIQFPTTKMSVAQLKEYRIGLLRWASDPYNPPDNFDGHAYDFLMRHLLSIIFQSKYQIQHTPAEMDFIDKPHISAFGPSSDIIVGVFSATPPQPLWLIANSLSHTYSKHTHRALGVPVVTLVGDKFFHNPNQTVFEFATATSPHDYLVQLAISVGPKIKETFIRRSS